MSLASASNSVLVLGGLIPVSVELAEDAKAIAGFRELVVTEMREGILYPRQSVAYATLEDGTLAAFPAYQLEPIPEPCPTCGCTCEEACW